MPPDGQDAVALRLQRERSARRQAEKIAEQVTGDLYSTVQELTRLNQALRDFVAMASHDIRNPITVIRGFANSLVEHWDVMAEADKLEQLRTIERRARHVGRLVDDLVTISRIEAGALQADRHVIRLDHALDEAMRDFSERSAQIEARMPKNLAVLADTDHLHRILVNYVSNALKYGMPPVEVTARADGDWVEIRVSDHGEGIPAEFMESLFEKFARADTPTVRQEQGTGLGLSIVAGLARANGGEAWYEPNHPRGACFAVRLPVRDGDRPVAAASVTRPGG